jgi:hypothetical protein
MIRPVPLGSKRAYFSSGAIGPLPLSLPLKIVALAQKPLKYAFENSARRIFPCGKTVVGQVGGGEAATPSLSTPHRCSVTIFPHLPAAYLPPEAKPT